MDVIMTLIRDNRLASARNHLLEMNVVDIADWLEEAPKELVLVIFRLLPKDTAAEVFAYMSPEQKRYIVETVNDAEVKSIISQLFLDDAVDFLEEMPASIVKKVLQNADDVTRKLINQFLQYPDKSAGSIMTIEYVDLKKEMTIEAALKRIKAVGIDRETIENCFVTDANRKLEGVVSLRKLILSDGFLKVEDVMERQTIFAGTLDDQEDIADTFKKYDLISMPVVDNERRLVGVITIDDVVDIIELENTEDFHRMAALQPAEEEYLKTSSLQLAKNRLAWLTILMISATFTGRIIQRFDNMLQSVVILAAFIPMLMDTGGNAGSQSSTLVIRGLALNEIKMGDILRVMKKEFSVSFTVGITLGLLNFVRLLLERVDLVVNITVSISLFCTVIMAKVLGGILPITAKKLKLDPALMAGPLITTIVDAAALMIYFTLAMWLISF